MKFSFEIVGAWLGVILFAILEVVFTGVGIHFIAEVFMEKPISFPDAIRAGAGLLLVASAVKRMTP